MLKGKKDRKRRKRADSDQNDSCKIADIQFSFNNRDLIKELRKRGGAIARQKFDIVREQDKKINDLFQDYNELVRPTAAFVTFESDDFKTMALNKAT